MLRPTRRMSFRSFLSFIRVRFFSPLSDAIDFRNKLISEAKTYAEVAGSGQITKVHISDATLSLLKRNFAMGRTVRVDGRHHG